MDKLKSLINELPEDRKEALTEYILSMADNEKDNYSCEEIAKHFNVSWRTINRRIKDGSINGVKIGKQYRISKEEFERIKAQGI